MEPIEFRTLDNFYEFVGRSPSLKEIECIMGFCKAFEQINVGCGCQKKARIARAYRFFMALSPELGEGKALIKEAALGAQTLFYDQKGGVFMQIN